MISTREEAEIAILREANQMVAQVLVSLAEHVAPGVNTLELDELAYDMITGMGARPAFLGYMGFPNSTCISVDEVIVHGIPGKRRLQEGQIVSMDVGVAHGGFIGDAAITVPCGEVNGERRRLMDVTDQALTAAIAAARAGNYVGDIGRAVQSVCDGSGFAIVRCFTGHGIGRAMHEPPQIPNYDTGKRGPLLKPGMVIAIEPMISAGSHEAKVLKDGWTAVTKDGRPSAHFEHSVVIREGKADILSATPKLVWGQCA